ncbi:hypothetical protein [Paenibacillus agaridevorans]|uniref:hypothetical protein n=1 Tax=Paenibacillus agaridevorans TaxID=171404 RepID=UPI000D58EF70|nr:hypothetical protein [Paenibacillus agaridevorans]
MFWTAVWFVSNLFFVAALITFLFVHRACTMAAQQGADAGKMMKLSRGRLWAGIASGVGFVAMCASFLINMRLNG